MKRAAILSAVLLGISIVFRALTAFHKAYAQDDFYWAYLAWLRSAPLKPGRDYYLQNVTPLSEIAAPLFRWFPQSFTPMIIARAAMLFVGFALVWSCYRVARLLGGSVAWSLVAANVLSWQFQFMKRITDIRADQIAATFLMLAAIAILDPRVTRRALWAGLACGAAVALTYKLSVAAPFVLAGAVAVSPRRWRAALTFCAAAAIAPVLYFGSRILLDGFPIFLGVMRGIFGALGSGLSYRWPSFAGALYTSPVTWIALVAGAVGMFKATADADLTARRRGFTILALGFIALFVYLNAFLFPYNYVIFIPILAPLVVGVAALLSSERLARGALYLIPIAAAAGGTFAFADIVNTSCDTQERAVRWIWRTTAESDAIFDWQGCVAWRPSTYHWFLFSGDTPRYRAGWFSAEEEVRRAQAKLVIPNYRLLWLTPRDTRFLQTHFVEADTCILVPGWLVRGDDLRRGAAIDAFLGDEEYVASSWDGILLDGRPLQRRQRIRAGTHLLGAAVGARLPEHLSLMRLTPAMEASSPPCAGQTIIIPTS